MKTIKFTAYLFYKYYSTGGTKSIPYFSTLCALAMIVILHVFQILVIFNGMDLLPATSAKPGTEISAGASLKTKLDRENRLDLKCSGAFDW